MFFWRRISANSPFYVKLLIIAALNLQCYVSSLVYEVRLKEGQATEMKGQPPGHKFHS